MNLRTTFRLNPIGKRSTRRRDALAVALIALIAGVFVTLPPLDVLRGWSIDTLTGLKWYLFGPTRPPESSPAVVVALDEETFRTPPFAGSPNIVWTREIGRVLTAIVEGGAAVVGFDIVYPISIEQSEIPFGEETLGARLRGFDRDFLRALARAARDGKVVLGQVQFSDQPVLPASGQRIAVGQLRNIRALNAYTDSDNVVRRLPLTFSVDGAPVPSMALELAARALKADPQVGPDGRVTLGPYRVPSGKPNTMTVNFEGGADDIPTFSLADLRACLEKEDSTFFQRHFAGKVVIFGTLLDAEDLRLTSKRFITEPEAARAPRCAVPRPPDRPRFARSSMSGVYIHATAVNNLIRGDALNEFGRGGSAAVSIVFSLLAALAGLLLAPLTAIMAYLAGVLAWSGIAVGAFRHAWALPLIDPFVA